MPSVLDQGDSLEVSRSLISSRPRGQYRLLMQRRTAAGTLAAMVVGLVGVAYFNSRFLVSGLATFEGDHGDGRFIALITSHWADAHQFPGGWTDLGMFFPTPGTIAYSDTFLLYGVIAAPLHWSGVGFLPALQWTLMIVSALTYGSTVAFLRWGPRAPWFVAIAGGVLVSFANSFALAFAHPQLQSVTLGSVVLLLLLASWRSRRWWAMGLWAVMAGSTLILIAASTFYAGWLLIFGLGVTFLLALALLLATGWRTTWARVASTGGGLAVGALLILPLFWTAYGPSIQSGAARSLDDALASSLRWSELFQVSETNLMWGGVISRAFAEVRPYEFWFAPTPLLVALAVVLTIWSLWTQRCSRWSMVGASFALTGLVAWLIPVDMFGFTPWQWIYHLPGASAFRALGRVELLVSFLLAVSVGIMSSRLARIRSRGWRTALTVALVVVMVEQVNVVERQQYSDLISSPGKVVTAPPEGCEVFLAINPTWSISGFAEQIDALVVSRITGLPTINGYSGWSPEGWALDLDEPDYLSRAKSWVGRAFIVKKLCAYELDTASWLGPQETRDLLNSAASQ